MDARLANLHTQKPQYAVLHVDIARWQSPVAQQFGLNSIPKVMIYGPNGKLQAEGDSARQQLGQILK